MGEPSALTEARRCLARAEAGFESAAALEELERGLDLLEQTFEEGGSRHRTTAQNLALTYRDRFYSKIEALVADRAAPEPALQHLLELVFAFDRPVVPPRNDEQALKIALVRSLIDRYYEGYPAAAKARALEQLAALGAS